MVVSGSRTSTAWTWGSPERAVPQGIDHRDLHRVGAAVALYRHTAPGRGGGKFGPGHPGADPSCEAGPRRPVRGGAGANKAALAGNRVVIVVAATSNERPW